MAQVGNSGTAARGTVFAFVALAAVWGGSFLFMKVGLEGLSPAQVVLGRLTLGTVALVTIMLTTRRRWPRELRIWAHMLVVAVTFAVLPYSLFSWAEQYVPSGLASIYNATTPIMTLLLTPLLLSSERLRGRQILGIVIGLAGVAVLAEPWQLLASHALTGSLPAQLACLGATASYGFTALYMRRFLSGTGYDGITLSTVEITLGAAIAWLIAPLDARGIIHLSVPVVLAVSALGVLGTGFAYIWYNRVLRDWGPARVSTVTYLSPVVGVVLGLLLLGEPVQWSEPLGGVVIILGILASLGVFTARRRSHGGAAPGRVTNTSRGPRAERAPIAADRPEETRGRP
ncbi:DMT family transporter [Gryllotalpicola reticulitermitis]|uniref:DMT family transporter n=1 Tax=Gryllotalpicola reticulitermitis TaxID=1184153 RepID=A0ABV8Q3V0_9MICO